MLPDVTGIDKTFDYVVPDSWKEPQRDLAVVGSIVRFDLGGRRLRGWIVADNVEPASGVSLRALTKVTGRGPGADIVDLANWAAERWVGHPSRLLVVASPAKAVTHLPSVRPSSSVATQASEVEAAFLALRSVVRLAPRGESLPYALAAARRGNALILVPSAARAIWLSRQLSNAGVQVASMPDGWNRAAAGATVVGSRSAAWAPVVDLAAVVVFDEHDEVYQDERTPTWSARDVAIERARRSGAPCVLTSPNPSLEALEWGDLLVPERNIERAGWPRVEIIDRRSDDRARTGLFSDPVVRAIREEGPVVCVLNRKGRARLLACSGCGELALCETCSGALVQNDDDHLHCRSCSTDRPVVCMACGSSTFRRLRMGVTRAREELEALAGRPVVEVTGTDDSPLNGADIFVGTEAVLHRVPHAKTVVFLDFDQELAALRYRASEQAFGLLIRAARLLGVRSAGGRMLIQTRKPEHEVLVAAAKADPSYLSEAGQRRRRSLQLPPFSAMATISGQAAAEFVDNLDDDDSVQLLGPLDDRWLVKAPDHGVLSKYLRTASRPSGRLRIEVDPLRV
ncbi:MAG: hypothetical protein V3V01_09030 [Acidimicrobiales bacterium]